MKLQIHQVKTETGYVEFADYDSAFIFSGKDEAKITTFEKEIDMPVLDNDEIRRNLYAQNCDYITLQIQRLYVLGRLTPEKHAELLEKLKTETDKIENL